MDRSLLKYFWNCGDDPIIQFALTQAHLNRKEERTVKLLLDECLTQEQAAEEMLISPRRLQTYWYSGADKLLNIPWVRAYAKELREQMPPLF